ncbi:hypothetical protein [Streptomyces sp. NPDC001652]|uniref:hypothetical protein n=1 Tax=Streptomyces sp. NPDC001652 TaxID=3154393 RepID=UPI00332EE67F
MPVLVVGTERNFTALRRRLFPGRRMTKATTARVAEAIRAVNPHADLDALRPGTVLSIPDLPELTVDPDQSVADTTAAATADVNGPLGPVLEALMTAAQAREDQGAEERNTLRTLLDRREVSDATAADADFARDVEEIRAAVTADEEAARTRQEALRRAHIEWRAELDALEEL